RPHEEHVLRDRIHHEAGTAILCGTIVDHKPAAIDPHLVAASDLAVLIGADERGQCRRGMDGSQGFPERHGLTAENKPADDTGVSEIERAAGTEIEPAARTGVTTLDAEFDRHCRAVVLAIAKHTVSVVVEKERIAQGLPAKHAVFEFERYPLASLRVHVAA